MARFISRRALLMVALVSGACSSSNSSSGTGGTGGHATAGSGGSVASGGSTGSGGAPASGGAVGSGGSVASGGSTGSGGTPASGGAVGSGGSASGGTTGTAGHGGNGTGGSSAAGGTSTGGSAAASGGAAGGGVGCGVPLGSGVAVSDPISGEIDIGPAYTRSPDLTLKAGAASGFSFSFDLGSDKSTIYNGQDFTPPLTFSRSIKVWIPSQYVDGTASPFMVSSDGFFGGLQTVVQNLADDPNPDHHVPPLTIIGITNGPDVHPNSERSLEYDTVSDRYWQFVTKEVLPMALSQTALKTKYPNFKFTSDPNGRGGYGCSSGGPAVMGLAWFGDFNRVFSFSGSYVSIQKTTAYPMGAWEYASLIAAAPFRPDFRVFLEVGQNDNGSTTPASSDSNWVISNQNIAAALCAKGNAYRFIYAKGAGHCDDNPRNQVTPQGMIWLWRGYTPSAN
jgi:iron(III)-enterobactin esterase